jgi:hypothetical protein
LGARPAAAAALGVLLGATQPAFAAGPAAVEGLRARIRPLLAEPFDKNRSMAEALAIDGRFSKAIADPSFALLDASERHDTLYAGSAFAPP